MAEESQIVVLRPLRISELKRDLEEKRAALRSSTSALRSSARSALHPSGFVTFLMKHPQLLFAGTTSTLMAGLTIPKVLAFLLKRRRWAAALAASLAWKTTRVGGSALFRVARPVVADLARSAWRRLRKRFSND